MCYAVLLSTTSDEDLSKRSTPLMIFSRELPEIKGSGNLSHPHKWHIISRKGCGCGFRHLYSVELGFGEPVDWYEEEDEDMEATKQFIGIVRELLGGGHEVECVDAWWTGSELPYKETTVDLNEVTDSQFRFFENHKFIFKM